MTHLLFLVLNICSPFDRADGGAVDGRLADGGISPDQAACCGGRLGCPSGKCGPYRNVGAPVDTLNGFAWLERTDVSVGQPWGPPVAFKRHYSTEWAQGNGGASELGVMSPGWNHSFGSYLLGAGAAPAALVTLRNADTSTEEYSLQSGRYVSQHAARSLTWDSATQLYSAERPDGSALVFDVQGHLRVMRSDDGGEARLRYTADDAACAVSASMPIGALCRVDFLFGRTLWFRYTNGKLTAVAWDAGFTTPVVTLMYTNELLTSATGAGGAAETYAYGFEHSHLSANVRVPLLTQATDADGKMVERFSYLQPALSPSRVSAHATPDADYTFTWAYLDRTSRPPRVVRETTVRGSRENMNLTWADGSITSVCKLNSSGACDLTRALEYVRADGVLGNVCARESSGRYSRSERDGQGRIAVSYQGLQSCSVISDEARARREERGYLGDTSRLAWQSWPSVDATAPAAFVAFTVNDFTVPASAADPLCGTAACQRPEAFNSSPLTTRVQRRIEVGRTLFDVEGTWGTQVRITTNGFDSLGRLVSMDGPRQDVADMMTLNWNNGAMQQRTLAGRVVAQYADFDNLGNARNITDENGNVSSYTFDALGRVTSLQRPGETAATFARLPSGRLDAVTEASGVSTRYLWSTYGQLSSQSRRSFPMAAPDFERSYSHSRQGLSAISDEDTGNTVRETKFDFDTQGRAERIGARRDQEFIARISRVDDDGRLAWIADEGRLIGSLLGVPERAKSHEYTYDDFGNLSTLRQRMAGAWTTTARFTWDTRANLSSFTDAKGTTIRYVHDDFARLVEVSSPDFGVYRMVYDEADNLAKVRRPDGVVIAYSSDASNRLLAVRISAATIETYEWGTEPTTVVDCAGGMTLPSAQSKGRLAHVTDASGDWYYGYWPTGRLRFEAHRSPGGSCAKTLLSEYDPGGLLTAMRYPSGARIEFGYPAANRPLRDRPNTVTLVIGAQRTLLLTALLWQAGELTGYTTSGGVAWSLARWLEGSPAKVSLTRGSSSPNLVRQRKFGTTTNGRFKSSFDGWGNPLAIEETTPDWSQAFTVNDFPALTSATGLGEQKDIEYLASGDRHTVDGSLYCYETGTHRLASVGATTYSYRADGSMARRVNETGETLTLCNDAQGRLESSVGAGGEVSRVITNFRHQRVAEIWPLNGLREDFRHDEAGRLLSEEGVGSLASQYPRPVREYVWLGAHPVAVVNSMESATGAVTLKSVTYVHSGHLGEPLSETDASGAVLHQYVFAPFGARRELAAIAAPVGFSTPNPYVNDSRAVPVRGARATKLHFTELALAPCDSIIVSAGYGGPVVTVIQARTSGDFWTEWLATDNAYVELRAKGCGTARGFNLVEALPEWGGVSSQARTEVTARPYAAAGQQFRVSMGAGGFLRLKDLNVASCDALEARTPGGQVLWKWKPLPSVYQVWTSRLQGDVDIGIWGQGCNGAERKFGFALAEVRSDSGPSQAVSIGLPGQKFRADGTIDNWYRNYDADLGRYLSPEPLLQSPTYVRRMAQSGMSVPAYAYALNNPLKYVDRNGLRVTVAANASQGLRDALSRMRSTSLGESIYDVLDASPVEYVLMDDRFGERGGDLNLGQTGGVGHEDSKCGRVDVRIDLQNVRTNNRRASSGWDDYQFIDPAAVIAHEFIHGYDYLFGWPPTKPSEGGPEYIEQLIQQRLKP